MHWTYWIRIFFAPKSQFENYTYYDLRLHHHHHTTDDFVVCPCNNMSHNLRCTWNLYDAGRYIYLIITFLSKTFQRTKQRAFVEWSGTSAPWRYKYFGIFSLRHSCVCVLSRLTVWSFSNSHILTVLLLPQLFQHDWPWKGRKGAGKRRSQASS